MTTQNPDDVVAVPLKHPWRWVSAVILLLLGGGFVWSLYASPNIVHATVIKYLFDPQVLGAAWLTVVLTIVSMTVGAILAIILAIMKLSHNPILKFIATLYIGFFRGTPLFVQILLIHFAVLPLFINPTDGLLLSGEVARNLKQNYGAFLSGVMALTLNAGAYISEIFRAGIQSIDRGQIEASRSLGMSFPRTMYHVILPQAFRRMLPPLGNNAISLLKDSSLISAIGLAELAYAARTVAGAYSRYWEPYLTISLMYWVLTLGLAYGVKRLEARYGRGDSR